jgi:hypothetical protein
MGHKMYIAKVEPCRYTGVASSASEYFATEVFLVVHLNISLVLPLVQHLLQRHSAGQFFLHHYICF